MATGDVICEMAGLVAEAEIARAALRPPVTSALRNILLLCMGCRKERIIELDDSWYAS